MVELEVEKDFVCRKGPVIMPAKKLLEPSHKKKWKNTLFGKLHITEPKSVKPYHVYRDIMKKWTDGYCKSKFTFVDLGDGMFSFHFEDEKDMKVVMDLRPWLVAPDNGNEYLFLLAEWCPNTPPSKIMFSNSYPFWIQVHDIPYEYVSKEMGKKIGEGTGHVVLDVEFVEGMTGIKNLRVRVLVDVTKKLATGCWLAIDKNQPKKLLWVSFKYEELPTICYRCGIIGHSENSCLDDFEEDDAISYNPEGVGHGKELPAVLVEGQVLRVEGKEGYGPWLYEDEGNDEDDEEESECNDKDCEALILRLADKWGFIY